MEKDHQIKIAIVTHQMVMGGIEKSLVELCKALITNGMHVTLYLEAMGGDLFDEIPKEVNTVSIFKDYGSMAGIMRKSLCRGDLSAILSAVKARENTLHDGDPVRGWEYVCGYMQRGKEVFDYAFAYGAPVAFSTVYVDKIIRAKKKFAWIHNDPTQLSLDIRKYKYLFQPYDKIVCVSKEARKTLLNMFPDFQNKTEVFYNIINKNALSKKAEQPVADMAFSGTKLLTVGRLCSPKGQDIIPRITRHLLDSGYDIRWYCIGEGDSRENIESLIKEYGVESSVILLGNQNNPYPYFKRADIYIQPSRHEGFGITLTEAKIFALPIITTDFDGAAEQITHEETGIIVRFDEDEIYHAIVELLEDQARRMKYKENLRRDKKSCVSKLEDLLR